MKAKPMTSFIPRHLAEQRAELVYALTLLDMGQLEQATERLRAWNRRIGERIVNGEQDPLKELLGWLVGSRHATVADVAEEIDRRLHGGGR